MPTALSTGVFIRFTAPPLVLPGPTVCHFIECRHGSLRTTPTSGLLQTRSFLRRLCCPFSRYQYGRFLTVFLLLTPIYFSLNGLRTVTAASNITVTLCLPMGDTFVCSSDFHCYFFTRQCLRRREGYVPLFLNCVFTRLRLFFL